MRFLAADQGANATTGAAPAAAATAASSSAASSASSAPPDYKALLLQLLDLDPATADDATIQAAFDKEESEPEDDVDIAALQAKASTAEELQQKLDDLQTQYQALNDQQVALSKAKQEADADEIMKVYEGHFVDDASKAAIRNILLSDKEAGIAILNGLKKPDAAAPADAATTAAVTTTPPSPQHDLNAAVNAATDAEKAAKISARAKELVATSKPKISLTKAYQLAETELNKAAA